MHNLKELRKNLGDFKKKFENRNTDFNIDEFKKKHTFNRDLISKKENSNKKKNLYQNQKTSLILKNLKKFPLKF